MPKPALLLSGTRDPVTPPSGAKAVASHLSNSLHLVVPGAGHGSANRHLMQQSDALSQPNLVADDQTHPVADHQAGPIVAAGPISTPVSQSEKRATRGPKKGTPRLLNQWAMRCRTTAW